MAGNNPFGQNSKLSEDELAFLSGLVDRAYSSVLGSGDPLSVIMGARKRPDTIRIAAFSYRLAEPHMVKIDGEPDLLLEQSPSYKHVQFSNDLLPDALAMIAEVGKQVALWQARGPIHFILLNEFACSFEPEPRAQVLRACQQVADTTGAYVLPGTFHCPTEGSNVAPLLVPGKPSPIRAARKQNAATRLGEFIRTPDVRLIQQARTRFANIAVWVCLDLYDPGLVLKLLAEAYRLSPRRQTQPGRALELLLIPSFNPDSAERIREAIKGVSRFSKTATIVANGFTIKRPREKTKARAETIAFLCGEDLKPADQQSVESFGGGQAALYEIPTATLDARQAADFKQDFSSQFQSLVIGGISTVPVEP